MGAVEVSSRISSVGFGTDRLEKFKNLCIRPEVPAEGGTRQRLGLRQTFGALQGWLTVESGRGLPQSNLAELFGRPSHTATV